MEVRRSKTAAASAADLDRAIVPAGARVHAPLHRVAVASAVSSAVIGIVVGVVRIAVVVVVRIAVPVAVIIGVEAEPSKSAKSAVVAKPRLKPRSWTPPR